MKKASTPKSPTQINSAEAKPKTKLTERQLGMMQATVCDLAGDLICNGGRPRTTKAQ